ncbi:carbon starvation induced protein CsiD [Halobacillus shinanisalinarum]|uniref:Carbon starvation induced protein CsiD n=2 Tax=Halobacillus shinanisalinarum TaxID=2932258 RepID=A0ABY4H485_9BACI|nr:glutarate dioxygenase GlaH [Halobacillus shinanisalinarum]UOQ95134.1 carbon starvation induced protein CsiD [Halobacillus shinanisalinarum]
MNMSITEKEVLDFTQKTKHYKIAIHPQSDRMYHITIEKTAFEAFFEKIKNIEVQELEYIPYTRFIVSNALQETLGEAFTKTVQSILQDRQTGGFTIGLDEDITDTDQYVLFSTALTHLIGECNFDAMSGKYYARFKVKHTDESDSYLRQAYRLFTFHTDGTFVDESTDWLLMMKMQERNAVGGESRLLHLDDWEELDKFYNHPFASKEITYKAPASKNVNQDVKRKTFFHHNNEPCICFIDQFANPASIEEAKYLRDLSKSMEEDKHVVELDLPVGHLVMVNNLFWLHGRAAFEKNEELDRELLRQRGRFQQ